LKGGPSAFFGAPLTAVAQVNHPWLHGFGCTSFFVLALARLESVSMRG
jgi:hypothetical protein